MNCDDCKSIHNKKIQHQRRIIEFYSKEAYFYNNLSNILMLVILILGLIIYTLIK